MNVPLKRHDEEELEEALKQKERKKCDDLLAELYIFQHSWLKFHFANSSSSSPSSSSSTSSSPSHPKMEEEESDERKKAQHPIPAPAVNRAHKCADCGKAFRFKSNLFEHRSLHAQGAAARAPFVCPFCAKTCRLKGNLKKHLQVHVTSAQDLERLWKRSFSRNSGRPRKNAPHAPLPKPGDDLGLVPVFMPHNSQQKTHRQPCPSSSVQWAMSL